MQRTTAVLGSALFFVAAPRLVAGLIPWWLSHWELRPPLLGCELTRAFGAVLIVAGLPGIVDSFVRFAREGLGTPAPIAPTRHLVVSGFYLSPAISSLWLMKSRRCGGRLARSMRHFAPRCRAGFRGQRRGERSER